MARWLEKLCQRQDLAQEECTALFTRLVAGELSEVEITALLIALKLKGEKPTEIAGAAMALRQAAAPFPRPSFKYADTCGTGGDGAHTVNISTAAAFLAAEMGIPVAKHGNRSVSSKCGSADLLEACGVAIDMSAATAERCLAEVGICFLMAPKYHTGMRHAMPVRRALATRTIFNILGPLVNPATPHWQVMGVYDPSLCAPLAQTLGKLGSEAALVVHGAGIDELALHGPSQVALWRSGRLLEMELHPEEVGLSLQPLAALAGGEAEENALWLRELLSGAGKTAHQQAVAFNAGALAWISGQAAELAAGVQAALEVLASGRAVQRLERLVELSHGA